MIGQVGLTLQPYKDTEVLEIGYLLKEKFWHYGYAREAAAGCKTPLVSAIGHEIDYCILDLVADLRAPTPSAAAELCVPDQGQIMHKIQLF